MRVTANREYIYYPNLLDRIDGRTSLCPGSIVKVVNLPGCPRANTMNHCHVADPATGAFIGLVHCNSLHSMGDAAHVAARIREDMAKMEGAAS